MKHNKTNMNTTLTSIGSAMSQTTINGGDLGGILKAGGKTATSGDTLKSVVITGATAGLMTGLTEYVDVWTNGAVSGGNLKINPNATFSQRLTSALYESAITTTTNTSMQSLFNKEHSFKDILKRQAVNTGVGALANIGAQEIGKQYHSGNLKMGMNGTMGNLIGKTTQLTLHAGLGALSNKLTGNDALSGAVSGVSGEIFAELLGNSLYKTTSGNELTEDQRNILIQYGGLAGGLSALINGKLTNQSNNEIANNMFAGQRVGSNAVENNLTGENLMWNSKTTSTNKKNREINGEVRDHKGIDTVVPIDGDKTVHASADGISLGSFTQKDKNDDTKVIGWGNYTVIEHTDANGNKYITRYAHLDEKPDIKEGMSIKEGQPIGVMGNSGRSTGYHLHYEIQQFDPKNGNWNYIDPKINLGNYEFLEDIPNYEKK